MSIPLDEPAIWPQKGRGGFFRNANGDAVIVHPQHPNKVLIYDGASGLLDFGRPYSGDVAAIPLGCPVFGSTL